MNFLSVVSRIIELFSNYRNAIFKAIGKTIAIAVVAFAIGLVLGTIIAIIRVVPKKKNIPLIILDKICAAYVTVIRGTPVVVQLLLMYFAIIPLIIKDSNALVVAMVVFGLNSSAYMSEIMRAGFQSVDKGQTEAGRTLGLSYRKTMISIVFPQAIKNIIPTILNELISLLKETSVAGYITVVDITFAIQKIIANEYSALEPYLLLAVIYLVLVGVLTIPVKVLERKMRKNDQNN